MFNRKAHALSATFPSRGAVAGEAARATHARAGDARSTTSWHKDHYENLYAQVRGVKVFLLLPPAEAYRLHACRFPVHRWAPDGRGGLALQPQVPAEAVPWSPVDPRPPAGRRAEAERSFPHYFDAGMPPPLEVRLRPGEVLYLPSLWQHHVRQEACTPGEAVIAVNAWYDMAFDCKFAYAQHIDKLAARLAPCPGSV